MEKVYPHYLISPDGIIYVKGTRDNTYGVEGEFRRKRKSFADLIKANCVEYFKSTLPMFFQRISDGAIMYRHTDETYSFGKVGGNRYSYEEIKKTSKFIEL